MEKRLKKTKCSHFQTKKIKDKAKCKADNIIEPVLAYSIPFISMLVRNDTLAK